MNLVFHKLLRLLSYLTKVNKLNKRAAYPFIASSLCLTGKCSYSCTFCDNKTSVINTLYISNCLLFLYYGVYYLHSIS